jgi:hypothetical protein
MIQIGVASTGLPRRAFKNRSARDMPQLYYEVSTVPKSLADTRR